MDFIKWIEKGLKKGKKYSIHLQERIKVACFSIESRSQAIFLMVEDSLIQRLASSNESHFMCFSYH